MARWIVCVAIVCVVAACGSQPTPTPDLVATDVARARAVAATLTADVPTATHMPIPIPSAMTTSTDSQSERARTTPKWTPVETASPAPAATPKPKWELAWLSSRDYQSDGGGYSIFEGEVKNLTGSALEDIVAIVSVYDESGSFITSDHALIEYTTLLPGQVSPYEVMVDYNPEISRYIVEFATFLGQPILTRDDVPEPTDVPTAVPTTSLDLAGLAIKEGDVPGFYKDEEIRGADDIAAEMTRHEWGVQDGLIDGYHVRFKKDMPYAINHYLLVYDSEETASAVLRALHEAETQEGWMDVTPLGPSDNFYTAEVVGDSGTGFKDVVTRSGSIVSRISAASWRDTIFDLLDDLAVVALERLEALD